MYSISGRIIGGQVKYIVIVSLLYRLDLCEEEVCRLISQIDLPDRGMMGGSGSPKASNLTAESIRLCEILHLIQLIVELYDWPYFSETRPASLLKATVAEGPHPPLEDRTRG